MTIAYPALFDTNIIISVFLSDSRFAHRCRNYIVNTFDEVRCAVVLHELLRGDKIPRPSARKKLKMSQYCPPGVSIETPVEGDWKTAGYALQRMPQQTVTSLRKMTNDALVAAICVRKSLR